ncbi:ABC transporter ATP-binding protein [Polymorphospora rubra]|uniref:Daunorubicin resistance protein DrrA family ABC transporter ATP-binding protein n=1 Tax=Polymorphospora rubra TaxID=338584 RepID=A0A810NC39_9ACTN|nr:ABC transporter ATP-binding protein [Polymorphospora rubra]BCJ69649.1 daunorubicin resistance protein DrrA family ABC transporter ATP-binding protein [Polymorphospora rubra]
MTSLPAVDIVGLTKTYGDRNALDQLSLRVQRGSRTVVLGHNGAGKSTLLEIIATLRTPTSGTVTVEGYETVKQAREARRLIGLTPQSNALDPLATTAEVLEFQGAALGLDRRNAARRTRELLDLFGLAEHRGTRISRLSGGTRRKVDLAVALVAEPAVVILDEPTTGLDPLSRLDFWDELKRLNHSGSTLLVSTQDLHEADVLATDIVVLRNGTVAAQGSPESLKQRVGERTLTLVLTDADASQTLLASARAPFRAEPDEPRTVRLALPGTAGALKVALDDIGQVAGDVEELRLTEPSLDDVFVALAAR